MKIQRKYWGALIMRRLERFVMISKVRWCGYRTGHKKRAWEGSDMCDGCGCIIGGDE